MEVGAVRAEKPLLPFEIVEAIPGTKCVICLDDVFDRSVLPECCHEYCYSCIATWSAENNVCPLCMRKFQKFYHDIVSPGNYIEYVVPESDRRTRRRPCAEGVFVPLISMADLEHLLHDHAFVEHIAEFLPEFIALAPEYPEFVEFLNNLEELLQLTDDDIAEISLAEEIFAEMEEGSNSQEEQSELVIPSDDEYESLTSDGPPILSENEDEQSDIPSENEDDQSDILSENEDEQSDIESENEDEQSDMDDDQSNVPSESFDELDISLVNMIDVSASHEINSSTENMETDDNVLNSAHGITKKRKRQSALLSDSSSQITGYFTRSKARRLNNNVVRSANVSDVSTTKNLEFNDDGGKNSKKRKRQSKMASNSFSQGTGYFTRSKVMRLDSNIPLAVNPTAVSTSHKPSSSTDNTEPNDNRKNNVRSITNKRKRQFEKLSVSSSEQTCYFTRSQARRLPH